MHKQTIMLIQKNKSISSIPKWTNKYYTNINLQSFEIILVLTKQLLVSWHWNLYTHFNLDIQAIYTQISIAWRLKIPTFPIVCRFINSNKISLECDKMHLAHNPLRQNHRLNNSLRHLPSRVNNLMRRYPSVV